MRKPGIEAVVSLLFDKGTLTDADLNPHVRRIVEEVDAMDRGYKHPRTFADLELGAQVKVMAVYVKHFGDPS